MLPVGRIGAPRIQRARRRDVAPGSIREAIEMDGQRGRRIRSGIDDDRGRLMRSRSPILGGDFGVLGLRISHCTQYSTERPISQDYRTFLFTDRRGGLDGRG